MKLEYALFSAAALLMPSACSPGEGSSGIDKGLQCAAMISAADTLMREQKAPQDQLIREKGLLAMMTYLNRYAIPKGLSEPEAFTELGTERDRIISVREPEKILAEARTCIGRARI